MHAHVGHALVGVHGGLEGFFRAGQGVFLEALQVAADEGFPALVSRGHAAQPVADDGGVQGGAVDVAFVIEALAVCQPAPGAVERGLFAGGDFHAAVRADDAAAVVGGDFFDVGRADGFEQQLVGGQAEQAQAGRGLEVFAAVGAAPVPAPAVRAVVDADDAADGGRFVRGGRAPVGVGQLYAWAGFGQAHATA